MIKFNIPVFTNKSQEYVSDAFAQQHVSGDGKYTKLCNQYMKNKLQVQEALLVHSGTAALEMAAMLANLKPGDEVITLFVQQLMRLCCKGRFLFFRIYVPTH